MTHEFRENLTSDMMATRRGFDVSTLQQTMSLAFLLYYHYYYLFIFIIDFLFIFILFLFFAPLHQSEFEHDIRHTTPHYCSFKILLSVIAGLYFIGSFGLSNETCVLSLKLFEVEVMKYYN